MNKEQHTQYEEYLKKTLRLVGLTDYELTLKKELTNVDEGLAEVQPDHKEKTLEITLDPQFMKKKDEEKKNILLHEAIHGRLLIMQRQQENLNDELEEEFVNDLTRGFERHKTLKW